MATTRSRRKASHELNGCALPAERRVVSSPLEAMRPMAATRMRAVDEGGAAARLLRACVPVAACLFASLVVALVRHERRLIRDVATHVAETERILRACAGRLPPGSGDADAAPSVPRTLEFVVVKRTNPRFLRTYGHWVVEIDGTESYGWWASRCPIRFYDLFIGTRGTLNGVGGTCTGGTLTRDPNHGCEADHCFHPTLVVAKTDDEVREDIRRFAHSFSGRWRYSLDSRLSGCHIFQLEMFRAVGLLEEAQYMYTRGPGCPFMYPIRAVAWRLIDVSLRLAGRHDRTAR